MRRCTAGDRLDTFAGTTTEYVSVCREARCFCWCLLCDRDPERGVHAQCHAQHTRVTLDPATLAQAHPPPDRRVRRPPRPAGTAATCHDASSRARHLVHSSSTRWRGRARVRLSRRGPTIPRLSVVMRRPAARPASLRAGSLVTAAVLRSAAWLRCESRWGTSVGRYRARRLMARQTLSVSCR